MKRASIMEKELKEFEKDWEIDLRNKSAKHHTGLTIGYDSTNEDGSLRLEYTGVMSWNKVVYASFKDVKKVEAYRRELTRQFVEIYKHKMSNSISAAVIISKGRE